MRLLRNILLVVILALGLWWLLGRMNLIPSLGDIFRSKPVEIDETAVVIQQIRPLAQLVTITTYTEVAADSTVPTTVGERLREVLNPFNFEVHNSRRLILVGDVTVHVGVDLQKLTPEQLFVSRDSVHLRLPAAEILEVVVNPSGTQVFLEEGRWSNDAVSALKIKMRNKAVQEARARGALLQAEERARVVLLNFFQAAGYRNVVIEKPRLG